MVAVEFVETEAAQVVEEEARRCAFGGFLKGVCYRGVLVEYGAARCFRLPPRSGELAAVRPAAPQRLGRGAALLSTRPAANSTAFSVNPSADHPRCYPQIR